MNKWILFPLVALFILEGCSPVSNQNPAAPVINTQVPAVLPTAGGASNLPSPAVATVIMVVTATTAPGGNPTTAPQATPTAPQAPAASAGPTTLPATATSAPPPAPTAAAGVPVTGSLGVIPGNSLLDYRVVDPNGNLLGSVKDFIIELKNPDGSPATATGLATYAVIEADQREDWLIPVPWRNFQLRPDLQAIVLPVTAAQVLTAPAFNKDLWPLTISPDWKNAVQGYWANPGQSAQPAPVLPQTAATSAPDYIRADKLIGTDLIDPLGQKISEVDDLGVDWQKGQPGSGADAAPVGYLVIERKDILGPGGELIPVPWRAVRVVPGQEAIPIQVPIDLLRNAPSFNKLAWPDLYNGQWSADLVRYWQNVAGAPSP